MPVVQHQTLRCAETSLPTSMAMIGLATRVAALTSRAVFPAATSMRISGGDHGNDSQDTQTRGDEFPHSGIPCCYLHCLTQRKVAS